MGYSPRGHKSWTQLTGHTRGLNTESSSLPSEADDSITPDLSGQGPSQHYSVTKGQSEEVRPKSINPQCLAEFLANIY